MLCAIYLGGQLPVAVALSRRRPVQGQQGDDEGGGDGERKSHGFSLQRADPRGTAVVWDGARPALASPLTSLVKGERVRVHQPPLSDRSGPSAEGRCPA